MYFVSEKTQKETEAVELIKNDVVIATVGSWPKNPASIVGKTIRVPLEAEGSLLNQNAVRLRAPDGEDFDQIFLYYLLKDKKFSDYIVSTAQGSANQASITLKDIYGYSFDYPPDTERRKISEILDSLDNKIQLNRETNKTLEAMAQALFKSWFVDFDPVIDNALAAGNDIPEPLQARAAARKARAAESSSANTAAQNNPTALAGLPKAQRELFPSEFEETDLSNFAASAGGWVPKGWDMNTVGDVIENVGGGTPKTKEDAYWVGGTHPFCTPKDMSSLSSKVLLGTERKLTDSGVAKVSSGILPEGVVLMSSRAPIGYLAISKTPVTVNQGIIVMKPNDKYSSEFLISWAEANMEEVISRANGSTFLEISKKIFRDIPFLEPSDLACSNYSNIAGDYFKKITLLQQETDQLIKLRDTLLPKLISGELRLPEAEQQTELLTK